MKEKGRKEQRGGSASANERKEEEERNLKSEPSDLPRDADV
jgi:hypothetical protein